MKSILRCVSAGAITLALCGAPGVSDEQAIRILCLRGGEWSGVIYPGTARGVLHPYDPIRPGQVDCKDNGRKPGEARLEVLARAKILSLRCEPSQMVGIEPLTRERNETDLFLAAIARLATQHTSALPVPSMARGGVDIPDSILTIDATGTIDVAAVIDGARRGRYRLKMTDLNRPDSPTVTIEASTAQPKVKSAVLLPGAYRLQIVTADEDENELGPWAPVLIVKPADRLRAAQAFDAAKKLVAGAPALSPEAARALDVLLFSGLAQQ